jgi:protein arginine kinase
MRTVTELAAAECAWLMSPGAHRGVVISSRVRLARGWSAYAFHRKLSRKRQQELTDRLLEHVVAAVPQAGVAWQMQGLTPTERLALVERQIISRDLSSAKRPGAVFLAEPAQAHGPVLAAMINEEDHLRLQVIGPGLCLPQLLTAAVAVDQALEKRVAWAVHPQWGYLTACHTNLGTGLRASVMLHLPALAETGELKAVLRALGKLHLAVRGGHGEGTEPTGHTFQISNARTLGETEDVYVAALESAVERVIAAEQIARMALVEKARPRLEDKVFRAWGMLTRARSLSTEELGEQLSWLRLGVALDVLGDPDWVVATDPGQPTTADATALQRWRILDRLAVQGQPAHVQLLHGGGELEATERDAVRADLVRRLMSN